MRDGRLLPDPIEEAAGYARHEVRILALANRRDLQEPGQPRLHAQRRKVLVNLVHRQVLEGDDRSHLYTILSPAGMLR